MDPPRTIWADNDGVRIEAFEWIPADSEGPLGVPLVFVSGAIGNARFAELHGAAALAGRLGSRKRRVLGVSRRGTGLSDAPASGYTPREFARDVASAIRAAGYERFAVYGQSLGVPIALEFAVAQPAGLAALVLGDYGPRYPDFSTAGTFTDALKQPFEYPSWEAARADMGPTGDPKLDERRWEIVRRTWLWEKPDGTVRVLEARHALVRMTEESAAGQADYRDRLHMINCPVLVLHALIGRSLLSEADAQAYGALPNITVEGISADHSLLQDGDPSALHRAIGSLLDRVDAMRPSARG